MDHEGIAKCLLKKNKLYRDFIKHRSLKVENKYKKYKNKLTAILRIAKQDYYSKLLDRNKKNLKGIWNVLNNIIKKNLVFHSFFTNDDDNFEDSKDVVHNFNKYFVNWQKESLILQQLEL